MRLRPYLAWSTIAIAVTSFAAPALAGDVFYSNRDRSLAINAWGGAKSGVTLRLHNGCRRENPDCRWTYRGGLMQSDRNRSLAMQAKSSKHGAEIVLTDGCRSNDRKCAWTYRDGMLISDDNPSLAISAWGGARHGTALRLSSKCRPNNPDCTWSR